VRERHETLAILTALLMPATAFPALHSPPKGWDLDDVGVGRHADQRLMSASIVVAERDQIADAQLAHVAEGHRQAVRFVGVHRVALAFLCLTEVNAA
jgi:hypothetical protein